MAFWDASAIVPLCVHQPASGALARMVRKYDRPVVWWGTFVEVYGAFARLARDGVIRSEGHRRAQARLALLRRAWAEILPSEKVRGIAEGLPARYGLYAGDSFQLAAALVWCRERPRERPFVCLDQRLAEAAERAGFRAVSKA